MIDTNTPPTRAVLLEAARELAFAREGYDLLDRKRQALVTYAMGLLADAEGEREDLAARFAGAYDALARARITMGVEHVEWTALGATADQTVTITERSVMGVAAPEVQAAPRELRLSYSLSDTTSSVDQATQRFTELLPLVCRAAGLETAIWRLAGEIRRTQRRVNALRNVLIPRYEAIVQRVRTALEEREREDFYRAKAVKRTQEQRADGGRGMSLFARLLLPVDGSATSQAVARQAIELARRENSALVLVAVVDEAVRNVLAGYAHRPPEEVQQELADNGRRYLNQAAQWAQQAGVPAEKKLRVGMAHHEVLAEARESEASLIVLGRGAEHELRGLFVSRVLRQIVDESRCPVLVLSAER
jgi:V/A-type H+/Na+-transporting ATPase subunit D